MKTKLVILCLLFILGGFFFYQEFSNLKTTSDELTVIVNNNPTSNLPLLITAPNGESLIFSILFIILSMLSLFF